MGKMLTGFTAAAALFHLAVAGSGKPFSLTVKNEHSRVNNSAVLTGSSSSTAQPVALSPSGSIANQGDQINYHWHNSNVVKVQVTSSSAYIGASFAASTDDLFYGVWEYPFFDQITNTNVVFEIKGVGNEDGINWSNARAPFFLTTAGYGIYVDTLQMGSFDFTKQGEAQFIFETNNLTYYIILPASAGNYKSILEEYTGISSRIQLPPDSGYGPTFWSDDFEQDFHAGVSNAQENYYDVVNHLYYNEIRATSMFADSTALYTPL
jgi:alpha-D-xyloside xylohydrolase